MSADVATTSTTVTVVVVTWQGAHLIRSCLASLAAQTVPHQVLVVDNASGDGTRDLLAREFPEARMLALERNTGFAGGVAAALSQIRTPYFALLNNDASAEPAWLERSLAVLARDETVAAVTARMLLWDDTAVEGATINNVGVRLVGGGYGADRGLGQPDGPRFNEPAEVFGFSGGAAVLRTSAVHAAGGMPARFFLYYEDTDLSWRLRLRGWHIRYDPAAVVHHRHGASTDRRSELFAFFNERNRLLMLFRCAPAGFAVGQLARFVLTTASLLVRRMRRQQVPDEPGFRVRLRLRVLVEVARLTVWTISERRRIEQRSVVSRSAVAHDWIGR